MWLPGPGRFRFALWYTRIVLVFGTVMGLLYIVALGMIGWGLVVPAVPDDPTEFTFEQARSAGVWFGLREEHQPMFATLNAEVFQERPAFYHRIAKEDAAYTMPRKMGAAAAFLVLYIFVLMFHWQLWQRLRFLDKRK